MSAPDPIYLDANATTPLLPEVVDAMLPYLREHFGNPSSGHVYGRRAHDAVETARAQVAALLVGEAEEIVFTSGGTEANNLALHGVLAARPGGVVTTVIEHPATLKPCAALEARGVSITRVGVDAEGVVDLAAFDRACASAPVLVSVMHSNNETGVVQPIAALAQRLGPVGARPALLHTDAAQSLGKVPVDVRALGVDLLSVAGHKLYAPKGVGALWVRRGVRLEPFVRGAGQERGVRPGTENVASLVGLGAACVLAKRDLDGTTRRLEALRERLAARLLAGVPGAVVHGAGVPRLPNTLSLRVPQVTGTALLAAAPEVAASTGSACHAGDESASAVILAMGVPPREALGTVRLSVSRLTTEADVDQAADALVRAWRSLARA